MNVKIQLLPGKRRKIVPTHITIHETDNHSAGADAEAHGRYLLGEDAKKRKVSWHYSVDSDSIVKHLPASSRGSHAGTSKGNDCSIGIEICVQGGKISDGAWKNAVELTKALMIAYGIPVSNVVQHNFWSKKDCPEIIRTTGRWDEFVAAITR